MDNNYRYKWQKVQCLLDEEDSRFSLEEVQNLCFPPWLIIFEK